MIWAGFILGLLSSFHCLGMCGPLALALPVPQGINRKVAILVYNVGRVMTYGLLGLIMGSAGQLMVWAGWQQALSIASGIIMVSMVALPLLGLYPERYLSFFSAAQKSSWRLLLNQSLEHHPLMAMLFAGGLNGLLPCGMVYMALAGAAATGDSWHGGLYMVLFGAGTAPAMLAIGYLKTVHVFRSAIKRYVPVFTIAVGVLLILRGMNLGIPYISPMVQEKEMSCCEHHCHK